MVEFLLRHKARLNVTRYRVDEEAFSNEIVPSIESHAVQAFAAELSSSPAVNVPLRDDDGGIYGWPADGVREQIRNHGGSIQFGWRLREWPGVLLTAQFHAVWIDPEGALVDITMAVTGDAPSLFVPDPSYPETFLFDHPPPPRYKVLYTGPDWSDTVASRIAQMKPTQRAYEERRANKAGKTLEEWLLGKYPPDPLVGPIAAFVDACKTFDANLAKLPDLIEQDPRTVGQAMTGLADPAEAEAARGDEGAAASYGDAADVPALAVDATARQGDDADDAAGDEWRPEYETELADEQLWDWAEVRNARRRYIERLMLQA